MGDELVALTRDLAALGSWHRHHQSPDVGHPSTLATRAGSDMPPPPPPPPPPASPKPSARGIRRTRPSRAAADRTTAQRSGSGGPSPRRRGPGRVVVPRTTGPIWRRPR
jgi:hypothetical protein